ncbi:hypothetical protein QDR66_18150, partial [Acinetobacter baumannii]|nr:hypothetical protein [Acinetobacter baumannii]
LTGVSYTETVYDKRNQVIEVREPKFNQDKLDTSLNLFNQTISRTVDKSTVSLTDSANKLSFNAETQKLSIQANAQAKRVMIKYWPKGSTATASNTLTVDMQATTTATAGLFVLDIGAIQANIEYSYSYSSSDATGKVLDSGTGAIKRSVNVVDVFSGGTVSANPAATATGNSVANTMGVVAVDVFNNYKLPITVIGNKAQKVISRAESGTLVGINYKEGMSVKKIQFALPSTLKGFGDGNFEVELSIDGQVYKKSVAAGSSLVEIALDNNTDKFLSGKDYNIKIYKRISATSTELLMNTTNKFTDGIVFEYFERSYRRNLPPMFYAQVGDLFEFEEQTVNQEGTLNNYSHLMMKNIPTGTSRVEVKYKVAGISQWSTLTSSAALYNNTAGWYKAGLNTLENNKLYDYQYLAYNANGEILGGGQGVINTALNQATITQKALSATDLPNIYIDKKETVNNKQDSINSVFHNDLMVFSMEPFGYDLDRNERHFRVTYNFKNDLISRYGDGELSLSLKDLVTGKVFRQVKLSKSSDLNVNPVTFEIYANEFYSSAINNIIQFEVDLSFNDKLISKRLDNVELQIIPYYAQVPKYSYKVNNKYGQLVGVIENLGENNPYRSFKLKYTFENNFVKQFGTNKFAFSITDTLGRNFNKVSQITSVENNNGSTTLEVEISRQEYDDLQNNGSILLYVNFSALIDGSFVNIVNGIQRIEFSRNFISQGRGSYYDNAYSIIDNGVGNLEYRRQLSLTINSQPVNTKDLFFYYRELGSNNSYSVLKASPLSDIYGGLIPGRFQLDVDSVLNPLKKYEIQYVALAGKDIVNRQQGIIEFTSTGMQVNTTPLNYGGDGFILFSGTDIQFIDQFKPVTSTS